MVKVDLLHTIPKTIDSPASTRKENYYHCPLIHRQPTHRNKDITCNNCSTVYSFHLIQVSGPVPAAGSSRPHSSVVF